MTADAYTATAFNDKPAMAQIKHANPSTNYGSSALRFCNTVGNDAQHFWDVNLQTKDTRADMVFQGSHCRKCTALSRA